jgi:hypothetical protein
MYIYFYTNDWCKNISYFAINCNFVIFPLFANQNEYIHHLKSSFLFSTNQITITMFSISPTSCRNPLYRFKKLFSKLNYWCLSHWWTIVKTTQRSMLGKAALSIVGWFKLVLVHVVRKKNYHKMHVWWVLSDRSKRKLKNTTCPCWWHLLTSRRPLILWAEMASGR